MWFPASLLTSVSRIKVKLLRPIFKVAPYVALLLFFNITFHQFSTISCNLVTLVLCLDNDKRPLLDRYGPYEYNHLIPVLPVSMDPWNSCLHLLYIPPQMAQSLCTQYCYTCAFNVFAQSSCTHYYAYAFEVFVQPFSTAIHGHLMYMHNHIACTAIPVHSMCF